jgi:hypothetical protein
LPQYVAVEQKLSISGESVFWLGRQTWIASEIEPRNWHRRPLYICTCIRHAKFNFKLENFKLIAFSNIILHKSNVFVRIKMPHNYFYQLGKSQYRPEKKFCQCIHCTCCFPWMN